jgi:hypothetical protein
MTSILSSNKGFGLLLALIFLIIQIIYFKLTPSIFFWLFILTTFLSLIFPIIFKYPNKIWIKLGFFLGKFLNPVICTFLYIFAIGFTRIGLEIFRKKLIIKIKDKKISSYWINRKDELYKNFDNQF